MLKEASEAAVALDGEPPSRIDDPHARFREDMPVEFLRQTVLLLFEHYGRRKTAMAGFPASEAHDLWPVYRRASIERDWRQLARDFGLSATPEANTRHNAWHSVVWNGLTVVTQSYVEHRGVLPRPADFRFTLARSSQFVLFPVDDVPVPPSARMYAILTHGHTDRAADEPGYADILLPTWDGSKIVVGEPIRLFEDCFPDVVAGLRTASVAAAPKPEEITFDAEPKLRESEGSGG